MRNLYPVIFIISVMFVLLSIFMTLPPLLLFGNDAPNAVAFAESAGLVFALGVLGILLAYGKPRDLKPR